MVGGVREEPTAVVLIDTHRSLELSLVGVENIRYECLQRLLLLLVMHSRGVVRAGCCCYWCCWLALAAQQGTPDDS